LAQDFLPNDVSAMAGSHLKIAALRQSRGHDDVSADVFAHDETGAEDSAALADIIEKGASTAPQQKIQREALLNWLEDEIDAQNSCRSLPFTFIFWFVFVATTVAHRQVGLSYGIQNFMSAKFNRAGSSIAQTPVGDTSFEDSAAVRRLVAAGGSSAAGASASSSAARKRDNAASGGMDFDSISELDDIYTWLDGTVLPVGWSDAIDGVNHVSYFNRVIGGARLSQTRAGPTDCPGMEAFRDEFHAGCTSDSKTDSTPLNTTEGQWAIAKSNDMFTYWLDTYSSYDEALNHTQFLRDVRWLVPATRDVRVQLALHNRHVALFIFLDASFELSRTGALSSDFRVKVLPTQVYYSAWPIIGDVCMLLVLIWLAAGEILRIYRCSRARRIQDLCRVYTVLNWVCLVLGVGLGSFLAYATKETADLVDAIGSVPIPSRSQPYLPGSNNWSSRHVELDGVFGRMSDLVFLWRCAEFACFWYTLTLMVKFFEAFDGNPRLSLISRTFLKAMPDIIHFLIIFGTVFFNFALGAYYMFGHQLEEWSGIGRALNTSFRAMMGDFNWAGMYDVAPLSATVWFWSFMILIFLVMLNMLLAIILDVYCEVKEQTHVHRSVLEQVRLMLVGLRIKAASRFGRDPSGPGAGKPTITSFAELHSTIEAYDAEQEISTETLKQLGCCAALSQRIVQQLHLETHGSVGRFSSLFLGGWDPLQPHDGSDKRRASARRRRSSDQDACTELRTMAATGLEQHPQQQDHIALDDVQALVNAQRAALRLLEKVERGAVNNCAGSPLMLASIDTPSCSRTAPEPAVGLEPISPAPPEITGASTTLPGCLHST